MKTKFLLPIGFKGTIRSDNNTQHQRGIKKGTQFTIVAHNLEYSFYPYVVEFKGEEFSKLNSDGPFLINSDIKLTKIQRLLYEE